MLISTTYQTTLKKSNNDLVERLTMLEETTEFLSNQVKEANKKLKTLTEKNVRGRKNDMNIRKSVSNKAKFELKRAEDLVDDVISRPQSVREQSLMVQQVVDR